MMFLSSFSSFFPDSHVSFRGNGMVSAQSDTSNVPGCSLQLQVAHLHLE